MTDTQMEKIENYLEGNMDSEEQKNFKQELENDPILFAAYNTYHAIQTNMRNNKKFAEEDALKNTLTKLSAEFFNPISAANERTPLKEESVVIEAAQPDTLAKIPRVKGIGMWRLAAAVFAGIIVTGTWYVLTNKKDIEEQVTTIPKTEYDTTASLKKNTDTFATSTPAPPNLAITDTGNNGVPALSKTTQQKLLAERYFVPDQLPEDREEPLEDAFEHYEKKQFANAATAFESADLTFSTRGEAADTLLTKFYAIYYQAISYIATKKDAKAIRLLKDLVGPNPLLQVKVQWYLALAYLRTGDISKATSLLQTINESNSARTYRLKANKLILELKKQK